MKLSTTLQLASTMVLGSQYALAAQKPNVLIIYTDEHNLRTIEAYQKQMPDALQAPWGEEAQKALQTPYLNRLANDGVMMMNCFVSSPVSTPSRASLMTSRYPQATNCTHNDIVMDTSLKTMAHVFNENGYATGYAGKWHLSGEAKPGWHPTPNYGWTDNKFMFNRGHWKAIETSTKEAPKVEMKYKLSDESENYDYTTGYLTDRALDFIKKHKNEPFAYVLSIPDPHGPNTVSAKYRKMFENVKFEKPKTFNKDKSKYPSWAKFQKKKGKPSMMKDVDMRNYWGMVKCIDDNIGRIFKYLEESKLDKNTIVIFTSDHGDLCNEHGRINKGVPLETSLKVPFLLWAPKMLKPRVVKTAVSNLDIYPTLVEMCGLKGMPKDLAGESILPFMDGQKKDDMNRMVFSRFNSWVSVSTAQYRLVVSGKKTDKNVLFDNKKDIFELENYYNDASHKAVTKKLKKALRNYCVKYKDPNFKNETLKKRLTL